MGPSTWNNLPTNIRSSTSLKSFKKKLKTFLFFKGLHISNCTNILFFFIIQIKYITEHSNVKYHQNFLYRMVLYQINNHNHNHNHNMYIHKCQNSNTIFKHNFPPTLIINYGQILFKIILGSFKHVYHQDY